MTARTRTSTRFLLLLVALGAVVGLSACREDGDTGEKPESNADALRNQAPSRPGAESTGPASAEREPNDVIDEAVALTWSGRGATGQGTLAAGAADTDVFFVPPDAIAAGVIAVNLSPQADGDLVLGVVAERNSPPVWFDARVAGEAEALPNVRLGTDGTWLIVSGRGGVDLPYRLDVSAMGGEVAMETEPNDSERLAHPLALDTSTTAYANRSGDRDIYRIAANDQGAPLTLTITPPGGTGGALDVKLRDDRQTIWQTTASDGVPVTFPGLRAGGARNGYILEVELLGEVGQSPRSYSISVERPDSSAAVELEPNDEQQQAQELAPDAGPLRGSIGKQGDIDWYRTVFPAPTLDTPRVLTVKIEPSDEALDVDLDVHLVEAGLQRKAASGGRGQGEAICNATVSGANTVEIRVAAGAGLAAGATLPLDYSLEAVVRDASGEEVEPNDSRNQASRLEPGTAIRGFVHPATDKDVYAFVIPPVEGDPMALATTTLAVAQGYRANLALEVYDASFAAVTTGDRTGFGEAETLTAQLPAGEYYVLVRSNGLASCERPYSLTASIDEAYRQRVESGGALPTAPTDPATPGSDTTGQGDPTIAPTDPGTPTEPAGPAADPTPPDGGGEDGEDGLPPTRIDDDPIGDDGF